MIDAMKWVAVMAALAVGGPFVIGQVAASDTDTGTRSISAKFIQP